MEARSFIFQLSAYDEAALLSQTAGLLEKRTEHLSRIRYPGLWKHADRFNPKRKDKKPHPILSRLLSLLCLLLGIFLFVPGLMKPKELLVPLLAGAIGIGAGIGGLWRNRKNRKTPFETSAALLFKSIGSIAPEDRIRILFSDLCMMLSSENIAYENFEGVFISRDLYLFTYGEKALLLQKKDLTDADPCAFEDFLAEKFKVLYRI